MKSAKKKLKRCSSSSNKRKKERKERNGDRISSLPDHVLHHILSFLDTEQAVQTCVLSKRWKYVWASVPILDFDYNLFSSRRQSSKTTTNLMDFVDKVLCARHDSCIQKFRLDCLSWCDSSLVPMFISYAVSHNVEELDISILSTKLLELPPCLFTCESLRVLKLTGDSQSIKLPTSLGLTGLKTLHLDGFDISADENFTGEIFSSCPNLENLILVGCFFHHLWVVNIFAPKLKKLTISHCGSIWNPCMITGSTPGLESFKYERSPSIDFYLRNISSLDNAHIELASRFLKYASDEDKEIHALTFIKLLMGIRTATSITLSLNALELLSIALGLLGYQPSPFCNLKYLKLRALRPRGENVAMNIPAHVMNYLLNGSPVLETLVMEYI